MIEGYCQYNYKRAILNVLEDWGGEARRREVIYALMNDPRHKLYFAAEEKAQIDPSGGIHLSMLATPQYSSYEKRAISKKPNLINEGFGHKRRSLIYLQITN